MKKEQAEKIRESLDNYPQLVEVVRKNNPVSALREIRALLNVGLVEATLVRNAVKLLENID